MRRNIKAQFWSFDVVFAIIIFSFAVTVLAFTWFNINSQLSLAYGSGDTILQIQTQELAQVLLSTGSPTNWQSMINATNTVTWGSVSIGLASSNAGSNLSTSKIYALMSMANYNYQATKQPLGTAFDYQIIIKSAPNAGAGLNITMGRDPNKNNALTVHIEKRNAFVNGIPVTVTVLGWTSTTLATA